MLDHIIWPEKSAIYLFLQFLHESPSISMQLVSLFCLPSCSDPRDFQQSQVSILFTYSSLKSLLPACRKWRSVLYEKLTHFVIKQKDEGKIRMGKWKHLNEIRGCHDDGCLLRSLSPRQWLYAGQYIPRLSELWWFADQWVITLLKCDDVLINRHLSFWNLIICWSIDT